MAGITGRETDVGLIQGVTWGTAAVLGAGNGLLIKSWGLTPEREFNQDDSLGNPFILNQCKGRQSASGTPVMYMRYRGLELPIALVCGNATVTAEINPSQNDYRHSFLPTGSNDGKFGTLAALLKSDKAHQLESAKFTGMTFTGEMGNPVEVTFDVMGNNIITGAASLTSSVTVIDKGNRVKLDGSWSLQMNNTSAGALSGSDELNKVTSFSFSFKRPLENDWLRGSVNADEPSGGNHPEILFSFVLPRYEVDTFYDAWVAQTAQKIRLKFTGVQLGTGELRTFELWLPKVEFITAEPVMDGPGKISQPVEMRVFDVDTAPTGFTSAEAELATSITDPFRIQIINDNATVAMI